MLPDREELRNRVRVGRYLVTGRIGRGGMGMVYRAVDETLEREVALKTLISEGGLDAESRQRFEIEAKAAARLQHPNIVIVYELGEDRGIPFIAMELLSGADLEALLRGGEPLGIVEKLDVVAQVCRGLAFAHERGIIHRDVKPSNIRLLEDGTAKIMDFGIAKLGATHLTKAGMMVGTVHYMSPEQVRGKPLDGRSDVFSLGVILYELLGGQRPFRGEGTTQILYRIVHDQPAPLDLSSLGGLGHRLEGVVARALEKDPEARYPSATAMADEIAAAIEELQRAEGSPSAEAVAALAAARQELREGRAEQAIASLQAVTAAHPGFVEARRVLRAATSEQRRRAITPPPGSDEYPELESTFAATRTRRPAATELMATVVSGQGAGQPVSSTGAASAASNSLRAWMGIGAACLLMVAVAAAVLLRPSRPAASPAIRVGVRSMPVGAAVLVDGVPSGVTTDGEIELRPPFPDEVVLTFRKAGYRDATRALRLPPGPGANIAVTLAAARPQLSVHTQPTGAALTLDGRAAGVSPLDLPFDPASEHRLGVALDGYLAQEIRIVKGDSRAALDLTLEKLAPAGAVTVVSAYPLEVLWHGRQLAKGAASPRVSVPGGRQSLTLVAPDVFLRTEIAVTVPPGGEAAIEAPRLGRLNVGARPDNCQVFVDGVFVDYPPILDKPVAAGRHLIGFRWPDGARVDKAAEVQAGSPAFVEGQKE